MSNFILGDLNTKFKVGSADCRVYLGDIEVYSGDTPTPPAFEGKFKLTLSDSTTVSAECDGTSAVTQADISAYASSTVAAEIGDCVSEIGNFAFYGCYSLTSCTIGNGVTEISSGAFRKCSGLTSITIPDSTINIGVGAFDNCSGLTSCTIGNGVTRIEESAFAGCTSLTNIAVGVTTPPRLDEDAFYNTNDSFIIYVPSESVNAYKSASGWSDYANRIQAIV